MDLSKLFDLFEQEEERRYQEELKGPEPFGASKSSNKYKDGYDNFKSFVEKHEFGKTTSTGENLDAMKEFDVSTEEASVIYMYTGIGVFSDVNLQLRNHPNRLDKDIKEYSELLDQALDKMPSFDNGLVYRDISNPDIGSADLMEYYESNMGENIVENAFISSHIKEGRWSDEESGVQLIINTKENSNGKDLRKLSFNVEENEVLFKRGTHFMVKKVDKENNIVKLIEI